LQQGGLDLGGFLRGFDRSAPGDQQQGSPKQAGYEDDKSKHGREGTAKNYLKQAFCGSFSAVFKIRVRPAESDHNRGSKAEARDVFQTLVSAWRVWYFPFPF
jgi:hypothetical protein